MYPDIKYTELLKKNAEMFRADTPHFRIAVLSNITIAPIKDVLEYSLRIRGINALVEIGDYDNLAQDSSRFSDCDALFIFYELANIVDALPFQLHNLAESDIQAIVEKAKNTLGFLFDKLAKSRLVVLNLLSALPFELTSLSETPLERICREVNAFARSNAPQSFKLVDIEKIFAQCPVRNAIDLRFFLSSRALYKFQFFRAYAEYVSPLVSLTVGQYKKVLVLDCDNTLWKGILGEDGVEGIQIYQEIQSYVVKLSRLGILVCLCSKNNSKDVDEALQDSRMILRDDHIVFKAVNWKDKSENLARIAETLNLGLESFVFLDDSDFEINLIRQKMPSVTALKVPADYVEYLWFFQSVMSLFHRDNFTEESVNKTSQYKDEFARIEQKSRFDTIEDYLSSLELNMNLSIDAENKMSRLTELTQKTNQFNLTTKRMTQSELDFARTSGDHMIIGVDVRDRFGDYGTTGLVLVRLEGNQAVLEQFLLSCRVIGRRLEYKLFDCVAEMLKQRGIQTVFGKYTPTSKNAQVKELYPALGFNLVNEHDGELDFSLDIDKYSKFDIDYIGVSYA